jgi:hypothetical protein
VSFGRWPLALTARLWRALSDSIALVRGMKVVWARPFWFVWLAGLSGLVVRRDRPERGCFHEGIGVGRPVLRDGLRARVGRWPPRDLSDCVVNANP